MIHWIIDLGLPAQPVAHPPQGRGIAYGIWLHFFTNRILEDGGPFKEAAMGLSNCFDGVIDPRASNCRYRLGDLILMMVAASLCGASGATEFALFARERKQVLNRIIAYDHPPSHDTFSRLLRLLEPQAFDRAFAGFAAAFAHALGAVVAIDGKALKRAFDAGHQASPAMTVSAFACQARLCLGCRAVGGENEVETALKVVELIDLAGKTITADALHCHHRMARAIRQRGGDYMLALKGNRRSWFNQAKAAFAATTPAATETSGKAHGRNEWRKAEVVAATTPVMDGHAAFARITSARDGAKPVTRYYLMSLPIDPRQALDITRQHWQIENNLHWMLDVHFDEDQSRARKDHAPANTAILNRIARNILQIVETGKVPISHRIRKCSWNDDYLIGALAHMR